MIVKSAAKLNLTFDILGLLPGGFHAIETVFQNIDILDTLEFSFKQQNSQNDLSIEIALQGDACGDTESFPVNNNNLIVKAARAFAAKTGLGKGLKVSAAVTKTIPIAAGLAGGSGNAAATLIALNKHFEKPLSTDDLSVIAATLGSDISFFLYGGTCAGRGRGEILEPIAHNLELSFLVVKPREIAISTPWIYKEFDSHIASNGVHNVESKLSDCQKALREGDKKRLIKSLTNAFEPVVYKAYPEVKMLRDAMLEFGCLSANISGSGPTLFGLTDSPEDSYRIESALKKWHGEQNQLSRVKVDTWTTMSINFGTSLVSLAESI